MKQVLPKIKKMCPRCHKWFYGIENKEKFIKHYLEHVLTELSIVVKLIKERY